MKLRVKLSHETRTLEHVKSVTIEPDDVEEPAKLRVALSRSKRLSLQHAEKIEIIEED